MISYLDTRYSIYSIAVSLKLLFINTYKNSLHPASIIVSMHAWCVAMVEIKGWYYFILIAVREDVL